MGPRSLAVVLVLLALLAVLLLWGLFALRPWSSSSEGPHLPQQLLSFEGGAASLVRGLAPGRYSLRCLPDDFVFEPASLDVFGPDRAEVEVRWRPR